MDRSFTSLRNVAFVVTVLALTGGAAHAQSAGSFYKRGQRAEERQDFDAAYEAYRQALAKKPKDIRYKLKTERLRFEAATAHVDRGRLLRQGGDVGGALTEFTRALQIDPANQTAQQELDITQKMATAPPTPQQQSLESGILATQAEIAGLGGPVALKPISNDPITLRMVEDTKNIYQAIGKAAGLNVLFDPAYTSTRIPVELNNVSLYDALRIVGAISGTFWKPVTENTILVAQNTRNKRQDLDEMAVQTFYLTNATQTADTNEIVTALRNVFGTGQNVGVYAIPSQNAVVMRATPDQLLLAQKLLSDLDRTKPEVVVDVAVLEVNREKVRNLGITLPQSFAVTPVASSTSSTNSSNSSSNSNSSSSNTNNSLTLNQLAHLNGNNFNVSIGTGTVNALLTDSDTRILQNPRIRATDGQKATLKIGSKIPIATGSFASGTTTAVSALVNTQFTYIDVGVNIDMTPTVHTDRDITLKMKIEVTSQSGSVTISSVTQPIISQRSVEHVIQLKEGEPSILAGILTRQDSLSVSGTPGLGELPLLKYVFGSRSKTQSQDEVVFLLIPHLVRESLLSRMNTRAIDTGTSQSIELRRESAQDNASTRTTGAANPGVGPVAAPAQRTTAAAAANAALQQLQQDGTATTSAPVTAPVSFAITPGNATQAVGSTFQVAVMASNARDLYSVPLQMQFNPQVLQLVNVDSGEMLGRDGQAVALAHRDEGNGMVTISASRPPSTKGVDGQGSICVLTFKATAAGDSNLMLTKVGAQNSAQVNLPAVGSQAIVHVK
ncbi:cohesin domain-containing protein [Terriglobus albidus]|uniref:cohesin domain-containing protein n=1 Tax=Terriglobus albidus TaxID=1592106 RepID=UPI0021E0488B|nr:cohesin domain-containing protein [Terriglobus albidus]